MSDKKILEKIKTDIINFKNDGNNAVLLDNLLSYLNSIQSNPTADGDSERQVLFAKFAHEMKLEEYKTENEMRRFNTKMFGDTQNMLSNATITIGQNALKMALLINGGAGVAMLAFIGGIVSKGVTVNCDLATSLFCFSVGVLFSAASNGAAYLSQSLYGSSFDKSKKKILYDMNNGNTASQSTDECEAGKKDKKRGDQLCIAAIVLAIACYGLFAVGICYARSGLLLLQQ